MATEIETLNLDMPIGVTNTGEPVKSTPYFEDYLYQVIESLGGEGSTNIEFLLDSSLFTPTNTGGRIDDIQAQIPEVLPVIRDVRFMPLVKTVDYTAVDLDFIEGRSNAIITLDSNANTGDMVIVANGDGTAIKVLGSVKITAIESSVMIRRSGTSLRFIKFADYWRII